MFGRIFYIINKIKLKIYDLFFWKLKHSKNFISINNPTIQYNIIPIINFENDDKWQFSHQNTKLISYTGEKNLTQNKEYPLIESWLSFKNETLAPNQYFLSEQLKYLKSNLDKKEKIISNELFVLPYYTSVFGHFVGDLLGSILYYLEYKIKNSKLFLVTPSKEWDSFFEKLYPTKVQIVKPNYLLEYNVVFEKSFILPRVNTVQNYILANNILNNYLDNTIHNEDKIFLTSKRNERIENIDEVILLLKKKGFKIIDPRDKEILELLQIIKSCKILICEKASIINNVHLCRVKPYYIFSSNNEAIDDKKKFTYAGIYKSFHKGLYIDILCDNYSNKINLKPYKNKISVDLKYLDKLF